MKTIVIKSVYLCAIEKISFILIKKVIKTYHYVPTTKKKPKKEDKPIKTIPKMKRKREKNEEKTKKMKKIVPEKEKKRNLNSIYTQKYLHNQFNSTMSIIYSNSIKFTFTQFQLFTIYNLHSINQFIPKKNEEQSNYLYENPHLYQMKNYLQIQIPNLKSIVRCFFTKPINFKLILITDNYVIFRRQPRLSVIVRTNSDRQGNKISPRNRYFKQGSKQRKLYEYKVSQT